MSDVARKLQEFRDEALEKLRSLSDRSAGDIKLTDAEAQLREVNDLKVQLTGRKSKVAGFKKEIGKLSADTKKEFAQAVQNLETKIRETLEKAESKLSRRISELKTERERLDVTIPGRRPSVGHLHAITIVRQKIEDIFVSMGYAIEDDREIETDYYNFDALNIPEGHPARESQDTFYTTTGLALRSQTSTVQIRAMERRGVPIRILAPGKVFRRDTPDMTHVPMFHQLEGLCVDKGITMAHLKGTVTEWLRRLFGEDTKTRFRPSYFPFTEPSAEFDFSCFKCHGTGKFEDARCRPCKGSGWIELGGSGMVHPNVLRAVNVDPTVYSGFAFGFGLDRMAALMYEIDDIRHLFENDVRFLEQFK